MKQTPDIPSPPPSRWRKRVLAQIRDGIPRCIRQDGWWLDLPEPRKPSR